MLLHKHRRFNEERIVIKTKIEFDCTWNKEDVQKLFDKLITAKGITELGMSMIFMQDEQTHFEEPESVEVHTPKPLHIETGPIKPINILWPVKEEPQERIKTDPGIFTEIKRIHDADLGQEHHTSKPILSYAKTEDGRVAIYYHKDTAVYTTMDTVRALPNKIPASMILNLHSGKRAALRGLKKFLTGLDASENETTDIDPYAPILTGGAKVDTRVSGKVEGDLE